MMTPHYKEAAVDIIVGLRSYYMWGRMGWADTRRRYRRTIIGPFWSSLSLAIFVVAMGLVWANLWKLDPKEYLPFLSSGLLAWVLLSTFMTEGCAVYISAEGFIKQLPVNFTMLVCALIWRNLLVFFHNFLVYVLIYIYSGLPLSANSLLAIPGLFLLCINGIWIAMVLGILCARYRDVQQIINSILQISMFITPIFWSPKQLANRASYIVDYNLLYHYVAILREPLMGRQPEAWSWICVLTATFAGWGFAIYLLALFRRRIAYWL